MLNVLVKVAIGVTAAVLGFLYARIAFRLMGWFAEHTVSMKAARRRAAKQARS